jgi:hypothetical protein
MQYNLDYPIFIKSDLLKFSLLYILLFLLSIWMDRAFLLSEDLYYTSLGNTMSNVRIADILQHKQEASSWAYPILLLMKVGKILALSMIIMIGIELNNIEISFGSVLLALVLSEYCFLVENIIRFIYLLAIDPVQSLEHYHFFNRWSSLEILFDRQALPTSLSGLSNIFSLFQLAAIGATVAALSYKTSNTIRVLFIPVALSYIAGLVIYTTAKIFFTL